MSDHDKPQGGDDRIIQRFRITYRDNEYRVSIPNYEGGEVVRAEHYDRQVNALLIALRSISELHRRTPQKPVRLNQALANASALAKAALADWE